MLGLPSPQQQAATIPQNMPTASVGGIMPIMSAAEVAASERRQALITAAVTGQIDVTTARGGTAI